MLRVEDRPLATAQPHLRDRQAEIDAEPTHGERRDLARQRWAGKTDSRAGQAAFAEVRQTLRAMCPGSMRCMYCEDSAGDEIEHILPKSAFPSATFLWSNYLLACGGCNRGKGDRYACFTPAGHRQDYDRRTIKALTAEPQGDPLCVDPRRENPLDILELGLVGVEPDGSLGLGTFLFVPRGPAHAILGPRAEFTIEVLDLNRTYLVEARYDAFLSYRARLRDWADRNGAGAGAVDLDRLRVGILAMPHPTVFREIQRQGHRLPDIAATFRDAPEILAW